MISEHIIDLSKPRNNSLGYYTIQSAFFTFNFKTSLIGIEAYTCRETFAFHFRKTTQFIGITARRSDLKRISRFFNLIENKLKLNEKTVIFDTTHKNVVIVQVPVWWRSSALRRQVYTLLLRCASDFYIYGTIDRAFNQYNLTNNTGVKGALNYFFKGNTVLNKYFHIYNNHRGFVYMFQNTNNTEIKARLIPE